MVWKFEDLKETPQRGWYNWEIWLNLSSKSWDLWVEPKEEFYFINVGSSKSEVYECG